VSTGLDDPGVPPPLDDEERAFRESLDKLVDWVRIEPARLFLRAFLPAFVLVALGGLLVGFSLATHVIGPTIGLPMLLTGVFLVACGPSWALFLLIRAMGRDAYVAIRVDGLCLRLDPRAPEVVHAWDDIHEVHFDRALRSLSVELCSGEQLLLPGPFSGMSEERLAQRIRDARRLAVWHRLLPRVR
jgi:hypothetical protein